MALILLFKHVLNYLFELILAAIAIATLAFVLGDVLVHSIRELRDLLAALYYTFWELVCCLPHRYLQGAGICARRPLSLCARHVSDRYDQWWKRFERAFESQFEPEEPVCHPFTNLSHYWPGSRLWTPFNHAYLLSADTHPPLPSLH